MGKIGTFLLLMPSWAYAFAGGAQYLSSEDRNGDGLADVVYFADDKSHGFFLSTRNNGQIDYAAITKTNQHFGIGNPTAYV
jgi:hypothetical protein